MSILLSIEGAIGQGILWGLMALGVYVTFRLLDFADLTVDGSFATGGAVCALGIVQGFNPLLAIILGMLAGFLCGAVTGILHCYAKIPAILAGILSQIGLYSINLRIMGQSNQPLLQFNTLFSHVSDLLNLPRSVTRWLTTTNLTVLLIGIVFTVIVIALCYWFFGTEIGSAIRATGNNVHMVRANGVSTKKTKLLALMISNGLIGLSGALVAQQQGYADVKMGIGAIVIGLASIVIGETIFGKKGGFATRLVSIIVGSIIYRIIVAVVLQMGLSSDDLKLLTALLVAIALAIPVTMNSISQKAMYRKLTGESDGDSNA